VLVFALLAFLTGLCFPDLLIGLKQMLLAVLGLILTAIIDIMINLMIGYMPPRVVSIPLGWIMLAMMLVFQNAGSRLRTAIWKNEDPSIISVLVPLIMLTVVFWFYQSNIALVKDIRSAWIERDRVLSGMHGSDSPVETCAIPVLGSSQADPGEDPEADFNIVTAYYYGFPSVTADHLCPPFEKP